ncbi:MAG: DUF1592 domain-containing protein [Planctomycetales bacterium]|nr:DUF1592 domain-containing protein [Planctomycetales bacterium]
MSATVFIVSSLFQTIGATSETADIARGKQIYANMCLDCHGELGAGVEGAYKDRLQGDLGLEQLTQLINGTMPEDNAGSCVGEDARDVAAYISDAFYALPARVRLGVSPAPRIELQRLTVNQYRNVVADLVGHFAPKAKNDQPAEPGVSAQYYESRGMSKTDQHKLAKTELVVDHNFGEESPAPDIPPDQFAIIWEGSFFAPETGYYEFGVRTENGARLYVNNDASEGRRKLRDDSSAAGQQALIDAWVSSGKMRTETARVFLVGARTYPIRLEFFKYKEKTASIRLEWKKPRGEWALLNQDYLSTQRSPRTFCVSTAFPADDRSYGYERGNSVSPEWHKATTDAAIEVANEVIGRLPLLVDVSSKDEINERISKLKAFALEFARIAYRRPLADQQSRLIEALFADTNDAEGSTKRAILYTLTSPHFLYADLHHEQSTPHDVASRLALCLWDSCPDEQLVEAAENGQLSTEEQIAYRAKRMLTAPQAHAKVLGFFRQWLELDDREVSKDTNLFPEFDYRVADDLEYSLFKFLESVVWSDASDYRQLLLADYLYLNDTLAKLYGSDASADNSEETQSDQFRKVQIPGGRRGVITHPYLLSAYSYHNSTSPIHRGVFVTRNIVGRGLRPPPIAVAFKNEDFPPDLTMREKITQLTRDQACMSCHSIINPFGFALENYDAIGRFRMTDNDKPIESRSQYATADGRRITVGGAADIAEFAVSNKLAHRAFVITLFQHLVKQDANAYGFDTIHRLQNEFAADEFNIQKLMVRIATIAAAGAESSTHENQGTQP